MNHHSTGEEGLAISWAAWKECSFKQPGGPQAGEKDADLLFRSRNRPSPLRLRVLFLGRQQA